MENIKRRFIQTKEELFSMLTLYYPNWIDMKHIKLAENEVVYYDPITLDRYYFNSLCDRIPEEIKFWTMWQQDLRTLAIWNQKEKCRCGESLRFCDLHHAIVSKQDVRGIKDQFKKGRIIHHSFNVVTACREHHKNETRQLNWNYLSGIYGKKAISDWYNALPIKAKANFT